MRENAQLTLIDTPRSWKLDDRTRELGRAGVARARAALQAGRRAAPTASGAPPPGRRHGAAPERHAA